LSGYILPRLPFMVPMNKSTKKSKFDKNISVTTVTSLVHIAFPKSTTLVGILHPNTTTSVFNQLICHTIPTINIETTT